MPDEDHFAPADPGETVVIRPSREPEAKKTSKQDGYVDLFRDKWHTADRKFVPE